MHSWNMGYDTDTNYTYKYFHFLNPNRIYFNLLLQGIAFPKLDKNFNACELGFGNGISVIMHSAASSVNWYGNDFNPSQVQYANNLARHGMVKTNLSDDAFDEFLKRDDLPMFDYICLHGIWSWISYENRDVIVEFIKTKLKVGGALFISYNVSSGFSHIEPFRFLLNSYIKNLGQPDLNNQENLPEAFAFIDKLIKLNPAYTKNSPWALKGYEARILKQDIDYVSHEFTNGYWILENFNKVADKLEQAKLTYVAQTNLVDNLPEFSLKDDEVAALKDYAHSPLYEQVKDFITHKSFRYDLYVKGVVKLSHKQQLTELKKTCFICAININNLMDTNASIKVRNGDRQLDVKRLEPIFDIFKDLKVHSYQELCDKLGANSCSDNKIKGYDFTDEELLDLITYAYLCSVIEPVFDPQSIDSEVIKSCHALNNYILQGNLDETINVLASPLIGGGEFVDDLDKALINIISQNEHLDTEVLAQAMFENCNHNDKDYGKDDILAYVDQFINYKLPRYRSLMMI